MTIRRQFVILIGFIVSIPLFCAIFFPCYNYFTSSNRLLVRSYVKNHDKDFTKEEWKELKAAVRLMPDDVQAIIVSNDLRVVYSTVPEIAENSHFDRTNLWSLVDKTSGRFYYQFSTTSDSENAMLMITRIPRIKHERKKPSNFVPIFVSFIFAIVIILIIVVIVLSRNIFLSIYLLEKKTREVAEGDLSIQVSEASSGKKSLFARHKTLRANEITSLSDSLDKMRKTLIEEQNRRLKFVMGISHDLRTPVAVIKGYTEALSDGVIDEGPEMDEALSLIMNKSNQLEDMINTLINFMKLDVTDWRDELIEQNITEFIKDFAKSAEVTGTVFKRKIITDVTLEKDILVPFDKQLLSRAFENLLSNAMRYTKEGDEITVKAFENESGIEFSIADTGCGIDKKDLDHIFDLFYRGTASRREEGMGIGLSVVKTIIDTHNWKISVESELNKGSVFTVRIPVNN